jgi:hypothetical protein
MNQLSLVLCSSSSYNDGEESSYCIKNGYFDSYYEFKNRMNLYGRRAGMPYGY